MLLFGGRPCDSTWSARLGWLSRLGQTKKELQRDATGSWATPKAHADIQKGLHDSNLDLQTSQNTQFNSSNGIKEGSTSTRIGVPPGFLLNDILQPDFPPPEEIPWITRKI